MAATRLIALHVNKGKTVAQCLADRTDYSENAAKTEDGKYISSYECDPKTCDEEFYIVATHVDKAHIHNHIIFNSTTLDCSRKFRDFKLSGLAVARLSDLICLEHSLSIIQRKPYRERVRRTEYPQRKSFREEICEAIDRALLRKPKDMQELVRLLQEAGYEYKDGKQPAVRGKGQKRFVRFRSLGEGYSVEELSASIEGTCVHKPKPKKKYRVSTVSMQSHQKPEMSFLIDIQAKIQAGKGGGYTRWVKVFNLKQMAQAMLFMQEHGISGYEELHEKASGFLKTQDSLLESIKADEARLQEIAVMKKHIVNYAKAKDVFAEYKASGYSQRFFEEHRDILTLRRAAKEAFDEYKKIHGKDSKIPRVKKLSAEYVEILERKKRNYSDYRKLKKETKNWQVAEQIVSMIMEDEKREKEISEKQMTYRDRQ